MSGNSEQPDKWYFCSKAALVAANRSNYDERPKITVFGRNHTPAFKTKVALAAINGEKTPPKVVQQFDVHANYSNTWNMQLKEAAAGIFSSEQRTKPTVPRVYLKVLHVRIGELTPVNDPRSSFRSPTGPHQFIVGQIPPGRCRNDLVRIAFRHSMDTKSIHICCANCQSSGQIRFGRQTPPTF